MSSDLESVSGLSSEGRGKAKGRKRKAKVSLERVESKILEMRAILEETLKKISKTKDGVSPKANEQYKRIRVIDADYRKRVSLIFEKYNKAEEYINVEMMRYTREMFATIQALEDTVRFSRSFFHSHHDEAAAQVHKEVFNGFNNLRITAEDQMNEIDHLQNIDEISEEDEDEE